MTTNNAHAALKQALGEIEAQAYRRGWEEAMAILKQVSQQHQEDLFSNPLRKDSHQDQSVIQLVQEIIKETPGLTGIQIVERAVLLDSSAHERTVRTALRRLRIRGLIKNENSRWFLMVQQQKECA